MCLTPAGVDAASPSPVELTGNTSSINNASASIRAYDLITQSRVSVYPGNPAATPDGGFTIPVITNDHVILVWSTPTGSLRRRSLQNTAIPRHPVITSPTIVTHDGATWFAVENEKTITSSIVRVGHKGTITVHRLPPRAVAFYLSAGPDNQVMVITIDYAVHEQQWLGRANRTGVDPFEQVVNASGRGMVLWLAYSGGWDWYFSTNDGPGELHGYNLSTRQLKSYQVGLRAKLSGIAPGSDGALWILAQNETDAELVRWSPVRENSALTLMPTDDLSNEFSINGSVLAAVDYSNGPGLLSGSLLRIGPSLQVQRCVLPPDFDLSSIAQAANGTTWILASKNKSQRYDTILRVGSQWCG